MNRECLECSEKIVGREDKKFCTDGCRNAFNNKINKDSNNFMRTINNRLRRNYRILSELNAGGKARTTKSKMIGKGFDFEFFTNILQTRNGNTYYFLYDQGYMPLSNETYILVRKNQ
jgi:predicted nucleic acid-binding Zn ribbon protein